MADIEKMECGCVCVAATTETITKLNRKSKSVLTVILRAPIQNAFVEWLCRLRHFDGIQKIL